MAKKEKLEPQLRPEFIAEMERTLKEGKFIKVEDLPKNFALIRF